MALLAFRDRRPRALRLALRVLSTTSMVLKSSRDSRLSRLASSRSNTNSRTSAVSRARRSRCSSSSRLSLKVRWVHLLSKLLVALALLLRMLETPLTPVRQLPKPNK